MSNNLSENIRRLEEQVAERERLLSELRETASLPDGPSSDIQEHIRQIKELDESYKRLRDNGAGIFQDPGRNLAASSTLRDTKVAIGEYELEAERESQNETSLKAKLETARTELAENENLGQVLKERLKTLEQANRRRENEGPDEIARRIRTRLQQEQGHYDHDITRIQEEVEQFVHKYLASMLLEENRGGPVVGEAPFQSQDEDGSRKRARGSDGASHRQSTLDSMLSKTSPNERASQDESSHSAEEFMSLLGALLERSKQASNTGGTAEYVSIQDENAAVRFLVRARVAQFHPRDRRKLRLLDFGRELDDFQP